MENQPPLEKNTPPIPKCPPCGKRLGSFHLSGIVKVGKRLPYSIGGEDILISSETWIIGKFAIGAVVRVQGVIIERIGKAASKITVIR